MFQRAVSLLMVVSFLGMIFMPQNSLAIAEDALPSGGAYFSGSGTIEINGQTMNINQMTPQAIMNWVSFSIAHGYTVNIIQPGAGSVSLNRVIGVSPSSIMGNLTSNGQIFLVNANGILFGSGSVVNAPGLVASTLGISNNDFLNGVYKFTSNGNTNGVMQLGQIFAPGGFVTLLGHHVDNGGTIVSQLGSIALAAGNRVTLGLDAGSLISVVIDEAVAQNPAGVATAINNAGTLSANGGSVIIGAKALNGVFAKAINNTGIIEATDLGLSNGKVVLSASGTGSDVETSGSIQGGDVNISAGGAIAVGDIAGDNVQLSGVTINGINGEGALVTADVLKLYATNGIGLDTEAGLLVDVNDLYAVNSTGGISVTDVSGALNVVNVNNQVSGDIRITSSGNMNIGNVFAFGADSQVFLTSLTAQLLDANGASANITADNIHLSALQGIGLVNDPVEMRSASFFTGAEVIRLWAENAGSGGIYLSALKVAAGATLDLYAQSIITPGDVSLSTAGDLWVGYIEGQDVVLSAGAGFISDNFDNDLDILAQSLQMTALLDIGLPDALELDVRGLAATAGGSMDVLLEGTTTLGTITAGGPIVITSTEGDIIVAGPVTSEDAGIVLESQTGSILAEGPGPHLIANGDTYLLAPNGKISPTGDPLNVFVNGRLFIDVSNPLVDVPSDTVYGNLIGTVTSDVAVPELVPSNPPGPVYFNGQLLTPAPAAGNQPDMFRALNSAVAPGLRDQIWSTLNNHRFVSIDSTTPQFYFYHPLTETDESAFNDIDLNKDAYEFIDDNINLKQDMNPYFGLLDMQKKM